MNKKSIILSAAGLKNVVTNKDEEEFIFKIGEKEMKMNKIFAEFISPRVSHIHRSDPTVNFINLSEFFNNENNHKNANKVNKILEELLSENFVTQILNLSEGNSIEIENDDIIKSIRYFSILNNNEELFYKINEIEKKKNDKNINELLEEIEFLYEMNPSFNGYRYSKLIDEISDKINSNKNAIKDLKEVSKHILYLILTNEHFKTEYNDSIFELINEIFSKENEDNENENEDEYNLMKFYEIIDINELSKNNFERLISHLNYQKLTSNMWSKLCEILVNPKEKINQLIEFDGQANNRFNGIIRHLQGSVKTNICVRGIINVTSSTYTPDFPPKNAVDFDKKNYFWSDGNNDWLKYDFKEKKIRPTHYSIKTRYNNDNQNPVNWFIEVSNTDKDDDWRIIDSRTGVTSVSKANQSDTFDISTHLSDNEYYRYIRFRCNGKTSGDCGNLVISSLEYFGNLIK